MKISRDKEEIQFSGNAVRLGVREWLVVAFIILVISLIVPPLWRGLENDSFPADFRIPYDSSEDYWLIKNFCRSACTQEKTLVIGDSVIWGHYVGRDQTLSHYLSERSGSDEFVNLGLDGSHPMALYGLIRHYGRAIKREKVILHMNLLWLSSEEADLQTDKEFRFNHPRLVPQFKPQIPCYIESASGRMGIVLERAVPLMQLVRHLQISNFDNTNLQLWTVEHPYANPLGRISVKALDLEAEREEDTRSGAQSNAEKAQVLQSLPWVELETSLQWWAFERLVELLESRGNEVLVVVGPLNEYVLDPKSVSAYRRLLSEVEGCLSQMNIPYARLPLLPGHLYVDTSHPQSQGYRIMAEHIWDRWSQ
jgi:hypothetical protein